MNPMSHSPFSDIVRRLGELSGADPRPMPEITPINTPLAQPCEAAEAAEKLARQAEGDRQAEVDAWNGNRRVCPHD